MGIVDFDVYILRRQYRWVGHIARIVAREPDRLTSLALNWRDFRMKTAMQALGTTNSREFGAITRTNVWTWELQFERFLLSGPCNGEMSLRTKHSGVVLSMNG